MSRALALFALGAAGYALSRKTGGQHAFLIAPLTLVLVACAGSDSPCDVDGIVTMTYPPDQFSSAEQADFTKVERLWNTFAGRRVVTLSPQNIAFGCTITKNPEFGTGKPHLGRTDRPKGIIEIGTPYDCKVNNLPDVLCFQAILAHEIGHMLGLEHVDDPKALMFHQTQVAEPTEADRPQCIAKGICT